MTPQKTEQIDTIGIQPSMIFPPSSAMVPFTNSAESIINLPAVAFAKDMRGGVWCIESSYKDTMSLF